MALSTTNRDLPLTQLTNTRTLLIRTSLTCQRTIQHHVNTQTQGNLHNSLRRSTHHQTVRHFQHLTTRRRRRLIIHKSRNRNKLHPASRGKPRQLHRRFPRQPINYRREILTNRRNQNTYTNGRPTINVRLMNTTRTITTTHRPRTINLRTRFRQAPNQRRHISTLSTKRHHHVSTPTVISRRLQHRHVATHLSTKRRHRQTTQNLQIKTQTISIRSRRPALTSLRTTTVTNTFRHSHVTVKRPARQSNSQNFLNTQPRQRHLRHRHTITNRHRTNPSPNAISTKRRTLMNTNPIRHSTANIRIKRHQQLNTQQKQNLKTLQSSTYRRHRAGKSRSRRPLPHRTLILY